VSQQTQDTIVLEIPRATPRREGAAGGRRGLVALGLAAALAAGVALGAAWSPRADPAEDANLRLASALQEAQVSTQLQAASEAQADGDAAQAAALLADLADRLEGAAAGGPQDEVSQALNEAASMLRGLSRAAGQLEDGGGSWTDLLGSLVDGLAGGEDGSGLPLPEGFTLPDGLDALLGEALADGQA
jgi:hypothetical protein